MNHATFRFFASAALAGTLPIYFLACGGNGARTGTQTGDEGDYPEQTSTISSAAGGGSGQATSMGGSTQSAASSNTNSASSANTSNSTASNATGAGGSSAGGPGAGGTSIGGAANDSTSSTSRGGVGGEPTDAPDPTNTTGGGTTGTTCGSDEDCAFGISCCDGLCVNLTNDINNCGACGVTCEGDSPFCAGNGCGDAPCDGMICDDGETCCGIECCGAGQLCCVVNFGQTVIQCFDAVNGTCPQGCPDCDCAAPDTPIATPSGDRPIASLKVGDLVYSVDEHGVVVVPIVLVNRVPVENHIVMQVRLDDGTELRVSPRHPLADRGTFADLVPGRSLGEKTVVDVRAVSYDQRFTHDILPGSSSGAYFAGGALIGSTLASGATPTKPLHSDVQ